MKKNLYFSSPGMFLAGILFSLVFVFSAVTSVYGQDESKIRLTFNVDDPARVSISIFGEIQEGLQKGDNVFMVDPWTNIEIAAADGCVLASVTDSAGENLVEEGSASVGIFVADDVTEETYTIVSAIEGMMSFSVEVDNPSAVKVTDSSYAAVELVAGVNELSMSESRLPLLVSPAEYGKEFYSVTLDGEEIAYSYGYCVMPSEGSRIVIVTEYPDKDCTLSFETAEDIGTFFTAVAVNDSIVYDFQNGLVVRCGDRIGLYYNAAFWMTEDDGQPVVVSVNGEATPWFGPGYSFTVKDNTVISVEQAVRKPEINVSLEVDFPANVKVYRVSESYNDVLELESGANMVALPEDNAALVFMAADDDCRIEGVSVNGRPRNVDFYNYFSLDGLEDGDSVAVFTSGKGAVQSMQPDGCSVGDVYTLSGVKILENATQLQVNELPAGIYIYNGRKAVVR